MRSQQIKKERGIGTAPTDPGPTQLTYNVKWIESKSTEVLPNLPFSIFKKY